MGSYIFQDLEDSDLSVTTTLKIQVLAAHRYGIKRVILPERNLKDLVEVPSAILGGMEVINF